MEHAVSKAGTPLGITEPFTVVLVPTALTA
jgi:hypothetical protein